MPTMYALTLALLLLPITSLAITAPDVCSGDPCVLSRSLDVRENSVLDFGNRAFLIDRGGRLSLAEGIRLDILARTVTLRPGARIQHDAVNTVDAANVFITTTGDLRIERSGSARGRIEVQAHAGGGDVTLTVGGDATVDGNVRLDGTQAGADGGQFTLTVAGRTTFSGDVNASGGLQGNGGGVTVTGMGPIIVSGDLDSSGGDGGEVDLDSATGVTSAGKIDAAGKAAASLGGTVTLEAGGTLIVDGPIFARGDGSATLGGSGGDVSFDADGSIVLRADVDASAGGPDGDGGTIDSTANVDIVQTGKLTAHGVGAEGTGGSIDFLTGRLLRLAQLVDVHGGDFGSAGTMDGAADEIRAEGEINADGPAGSIVLSTLVGPSGQPALSPVTVSGNLHARATLTESGGEVDIEGCDVTVAGGAQLTTRGDASLNVVTAHRTMRIAGAFSAIPNGTNALVYRQAVPNTTGASFDPAATLTRNAALSDCLPEEVAVCGNGIPEGDESCDDGNLAPCDGCSATCTDDTCGNGVPGECGQVCDDGNVMDGDGCDANCTLSGCGNNRVTGAEECDDGNLVDGDGCSAACRIEAPDCGNDELNAGEQCDDGNTTSCDGCSSLCFDETCGNNILECDELCDAGNDASCDGDLCSASCVPEACGNGLTECAEACDAGADNGAPGSGCSGFCAVCDVGSGADCPCALDSDCHPDGRCGGRACSSDGLCISAEIPVVDDGDPCNGVETCTDGVSVAGTPVTGFPGIACRLDAIDLTLAGATTDDISKRLGKKLPKKLRAIRKKLDKAAASAKVKKQQKLLRRVDKQLGKLAKLIARSLLKGKIVPALADAITAAVTAAQIEAQATSAGLSP